MGGKGAGAQGRRHAINTRSWQWQRCSVSTEACPFRDCVPAAWRVMPLTARELRCCTDVAVVTRREPGARQLHSVSRNSRSVVKRRMLAARCSVRFDFSPWCRVYIAPWDLKRRMIIDGGASLKFSDPLRDRTRQPDFHDCDTAFGGTAGDSYQPTYPMTGLGP